MTSPRFAQPVVRRLFALAFLGIFSLTLTGCARKPQAEQAVDATAKSQANHVKPSQPRQVLTLDWTLSAGQRGKPET